MTLIEQLGGYDEAKKCLSTPTARECIKDELRKELLEYRRENNIFEVGDYIIILSENTKKDREFYQISEDDIGSHWINLVEFRHVTTQEIEVGYRI